MQILKYLLRAPLFFFTYFFICYHFSSHLVVGLLHPPFSSRKSIISVSKLWRKIILATLFHCCCYVKISRCGGVRSSIMLVSDRTFPFLLLFWGKKLSSPELAMISKVWVYPHAVWLLIGGWLHYGECCFSPATVQAVSLPVPTIVPFVVDYCNSPFWTKAGPIVYIRFRYIEQKASLVSISLGPA